MSPAPLHLVDPTPARRPGPGVRFTAVHKRFGRVEVLRGVDLSVAPARVTAILGPNGAGKSTLIKCLLGLAHPDAGAIEVGGRAPGTDPAARADIGYAPQAPRFPEHSSGRRILAMLSALRGATVTADDPVFAAFGLGPELDKPTRALSGGTRQRLSVALALAFQPRVLVLDEPTAGLDPVASGVLKERLRHERRAGTTILLTSHLLGEVEDLADDVVLLLEGQVRFTGSLRHLFAITGESRLEAAIAHLMRHPGARR
ncbi:MAG TPA: ABC transporter ATP-binding protein [Gemmatimonadales bacterium]|nr:ABC transporter ATP-binding protein [Gemmatimonadales bacterium]